MAHVGWTKQRSRPARPLFPSQPTATLRPNGRWDPSARLANATKDISMKRALVVALVVLAGLPGLAATSADASTTSSHAVLTLLVNVAPSELPASGGTVTVAGRVRNAQSCQLRLLSRQGFPVVYSHNPTTACRSGAYTAHVTLGANPSPVARTVAFALVARSGTLLAIRRFYVTLAAAPKPQILSARAFPAYLWAKGGQVTVAGRVRNAQSCQLRLLSRQGFPVVYSHNPTTACRSGAYTAHVTLGANPSPVARTVAFALVARSGTLLAIRRFYVTLAAAPKPQILSARAFPAYLWAKGGQVTVAGRVRNAQSCQLRLLSRQGFPVVYSHNPTTACRSGAYTAHVTLGANPSPVARTVAFALVARSGTLLAIRRFYVTLAAAPKPQILSARAFPAYLWAKGGQVTVAGRVRNAQSCQLRLLSRQGFPVVYSHNPTTACRSGAYTAHVTLGANPSPVARTVAFALVARSGTLLAIRRFYVTLAAAPKPQILSARAFPAYLWAKGGQVTVAGRVRNAQSCQLRLLSRQGFPVVYSHNPTTACRSGAYTAHVTLGANPSPVARTVAFALVARSGTLLAIRRFYVTLAAAPKPQILSARAFPAYLWAKGGQVTVAGRVRNAQSCQLRLLSRQGFPVVYSHNPTTACRSGAYTAHVTLGANPSPVARTVAFALVARSGTLLAIRRFYVTLAAAPKPQILSARAFPA